MLDDFMESAIASISLEEWDDRGVDVGAADTPLHSQTLLPPPRSKVDLHTTRLPAESSVRAAVLHGEAAAAAMDARTRSLSEAAGPGGPAVTPVKRLAATLLSSATPECEPARASRAAPPRVPLAPSPLMSEAVRLSGAAPFFLQRAIELGDARAAASLAQLSLALQLASAPATTDASTTGRSRGGAGQRAVSTADLAFAGGSGYIGGLGVQSAHQLLRVAASSVASRSFVSHAGTNDAFALNTHSVNSGASPAPPFVNERDGSSSQARGPSGFPLALGGEGGAAGGGSRSSSRQPQDASGAAGLQPTGRWGVPEAVPSTPSSSPSTDAPAAAQRAVRSSSSISAGSHGGPGALGSVPASGLASPGPSVAAASTGGGPLRPPRRNPAFVRYGSSYHGNSGLGASLQPSVPEAGTPTSGASAMSGGVVTERSSLNLRKV